MRFETIVVGTDGSANASRALDAAADLAADGSTVHVICAYQPLADREISDAFATLPAEFRETYDPVAGPRETLVRAERYLEERGIDHKSHLVNGHPASAILDLAETTGADLIVVGSRGLGMATRFLRGSTSAHIANHAHCSFLIVQE
jgi:nucleotide-binding universal stress UspA family protein